ncbi:ABC transporter ATP-binding protein [Amycolatopsis albispora]|uniref:Multidrug ABC transporter ATP-binding protein n=1 Tax=Amycolatopsis albispora TaxID=1804986 RepID=A0A344LJD0_9PSEU|nr:ABC transporter ATP-binding protein [Amycolatopsis albispora]AXB48154.1 multidrug ABC transporter ATP-binding protein [Amycolatopsis albispora]
MSLPVADAPEVRRATWRLIRADRRAMALVLLLNGLAALAGLVAPWLVGRIVDQVGAGTATVSTVDTLALAIVGCAVAQVLLTRFARNAGHRLGERTLARLREDFVDETLSLPAPVVERTGTGDLMARGSADVAIVGVTLRDAAPTLFISSVQLTFVFAALFVLDPLFGVCAMVGLPLVAAISRWYLRRARDAYLHEGQTLSEMADSLVETAEGARTVEAFGLQSRQIAAADARVRRAYTARRRTLFLRSVFYPVVDFVYALPAAVLLLAGGVFVANDLVTLGAAVSAVLYAWQLTEPMDFILDWLDQLQRSGASFARLKGVAKAVPDRAPSAEVPVDDRLVVSGVRYAYGSGEDVLHGVDLSVRPGERLALVGPSGAGKSTLGRLLAGLAAPGAGSVTVGGVPVAELAPEVLRERVVLVTQEHHVFLGTIRDNLTIAAPDASDSRLLAALDVVDAGWVRALPSGLDTRDLRLDAPRAQQLALARVVLADPHTVVLDEATALLDPRTARNVERAVAAVLEGRTVVAIAHRLHTAHDADRIAVVDGGRITELGPHDVLVAAGGTYSALWHSWHGDR